jgi:hypothetical protein
MIGRLLKVTLWLLAGHAVLAGLFWALLNVPESNVLMLAASAALVLTLLLVAAMVESRAVVQLDASSIRPLRWFVAASVPALVVALVIRLAFSALYDWMGAWHEQHSGEIDAWLIARFDWTRTAWLHRGIGLANDFLRDVLGLSLAVGAFAAGVLGGLGDLFRLRWVRRALAPRTLLIVTIAVVGLIWLPWRAASWRPTSLPPTYVQPLLAALKLGLVAVFVHVGWALVLWSATPRPNNPQPTSDQSPATGEQVLRQPTG